MLQDWLKVKQPLQSSVSTMLKILTVSSLTSVLVWHTMYQGLCWEGSWPIWGACRGAGTGEMLWSKQTILWNGHPVEKKYYPFMVSSFLKMHCLYLNMLLKELPLLYGARRQFFADNLLGFFGLQKTFHTQVLQNFTLPSSSSFFSRFPTYLETWASTCSSNWSMTDPTELFSLVWNCQIADN